MQPARDPVVLTPRPFAVQADRLSRRFGKVVALDDVSVQVQQGEFFSLLGPSGCGKTTLLRIVAGLDHPDTGALTIMGKNASGWAPHDRPVNTVFQNYALFPHLTAWDNIAFGLRMKKVSERDVRERVDRVVDLVQIRGLETRRPNELSGGQKQRVALARAIVNEPKILLLDEPLGALDLKLRRQLQVELHQLQRRLGITFIYVTHDQDEAITMSDRIAVMHEGKIVQLGSPAELYERPRNRFVAQFLGSCNLVEGSFKENQGEHAIIETAPGILRVPEQFGKDAGDRATLAIRPEKILLSQGTTAGGPNEFTGKVEDLVYSGAETHFAIRVGEKVFNTCVFNSAAHLQLNVGDSVVLRLPPDSLVLLED